jgi:hypothetical protein
VVLKATVMFGCCNGWVPLRPKLQAVDVHAHNNLNTKICERLHDD